MDLIAQLHPHSVLEVGSGTGQNLFVLSAQFPGIAFTGLELTAAGVNTARAIASCAKLPDELARFSPRPIRDDTAHRHVEFVEGSGSSLPFPDGSFDLVYTVLALEQMERVREDALREIARVSAGAAAMIEPFRDWNASGIARNRVVAKGYFSARLSDLRSLGLEPLFTDSSLPRKLDFGVGIVVARAN
jgi:SAM-dependent methyltransferase